ncbi:MAG: serine protease, partial [Methanothrix sp.]|nr:serine protease [Methanothrix sp.]
MDVIDQIKPAIVAILLANEGQNVQEAKPNGTGFFVTSDGYILTCYHVVEPLIEFKSLIRVKTANRIFEADYIEDKSRSQKYLDWAVLKIREKGKFPCLRLLAESSQGDEWCTIGYELAERANGVPNMGKIIGAFDRTEATSRDIDLKSANPIRGGVSGSPLFNKRTNSVAGLIKEVVKDTQAFATSIESVFQAWPELKDLNLGSELLIDTTQGSKMPLPSIWNVPFQRNPNFTGRQDILAHLAIALDSGESGAWKQALWGMGGVGKT